MSVCSCTSFSLLLLCYYPHVSPAVSVCSTKLCQHVITSIINVTNSVMNVINSVMNVVDSVMNVIDSVMNVIGLAMNMISPVMTTNNFITHLVVRGYCK